MWRGRGALTAIRRHGHTGLKGARVEMLSALPSALPPDSAFDSQTPARPCGRITRRLTHRIMRMSVYLLPSPASSHSLRRCEDFKWIRPTEFDRFAFSTAQRKIIDIVLAKTNEKRERNDDD